VLIPSYPVNKCILSSLLFFVFCFFLNSVLYNLMRQLVAYLCFELFLTSTSKYTEVCRGSIHTFALTKHYLIFSNDPCVKYSTSRNREVEFRWPVESLNKVFLLYPHLIFKVSRYSTYRTFDVYFFLILTDKKFIRSHRH
jgi:hypothetical protein